MTLAVIIATITLILSYPRLTSSFTYLPVDAALKHQWEDYPIKLNQFPGLIDTAKHSIEQLDEARYWQGLGWLHYLHASAQGITTREGKQSLSHARNAFETFLKKSPASPAEWLRLAWTHAQLGHAAEEVVNTLKMSLYTGRAERYLMPNRLELALRYAEHFAPEDNGMLQDQLQLTWRFYQRDMLIFINTGAYKKSTLYRLLGNNPELIEQINSELNRISSLQTEEKGRLALRHEVQQSPFETSWSPA
jgi:hypothetical protein